MSSETGSTATDESPHNEPLNRTLVIGPGAAGNEICRRVIEYCSEMSGDGTLPRVQCISLVFSADSISPVSGNNSFIQLKYPRNILPEDYAAIKTEEQWNWLPEADLTDQQGYTRFRSRMALFNSAAEIRAELLRLRKLYDQQAGSQLSVFVAADAGEPEGNAMFLDMAALAYDVFGDSAGCFFYGILCMPGYGSSPQHRAEAYALLKETDYILHGGSIRCSYPDGSTVVMNGKIFSNGKLFILDRQQFRGACAGHDKTGIESASRFIGLMTVPGFSAAHKSVQPGAEVAVKDAGPCWSSFGICRRLNPAAAARDAIAAHVAVSVLEEFFKPVDPEELLGELDRIKNIPGSLCGASCADILSKVNPSHGRMIESAAADIRGKFDRASADTEDEKTADAFRVIADAYSAHGIESFRYGLVTAMEIRASIELEKIKIILMPEINKMVNDPGKGFYFTLAALDSICDRHLSLHGLLSSSSGKIEMYTADEMLRGTEENLANAAGTIAGMASFNYGQFVYICMIEASMHFLEKFIFFLRDVRESISEKIIVHAAKLRDESRVLADELVRGLNINAAGSSGTENSGSAGISEAFPGMGINTCGIARQLEPACLLRVAGSEVGGQLSGYTRFRDRLAETVNSFINSESSAAGGLPAGIKLQDHLNRMLVLSEPAIGLHGTKTPLLKKTSALFTCDAFPGDFSPEVQQTALNKLTPGIIIHNCLSLSREAVMISIVSGFNLRDVNRIYEYSGSYHEANPLLKPLHIFNNATYFPDPLGHEYMEPAALWSALLLLKLASEENGIYTLDESLWPILRETGAGGKYKKVVTDTARRLVENAAFGPAAFELIADAVNMPGMLAKGSGGGIVFRREYASAIRDIIESQNLSGTGKVSGEHHEVFSTTADIALFLADHPAVADFILNTIKSILAATSQGNSPGAFVMLPASRIALTPVPSFESDRSFADYCLEYGSTGFYSAMKNILIVKLDEYISEKFGSKGATPASSAAGIAEFLRAVESRVPSCVINGVKAIYGVKQE